MNTRYTIHNKAAAVTIHGETDSKRNGTTAAALLNRHFHGIDIACMVADPEVPGFSAVTSFGIMSIKFEDLT